MKFDLCLPSRRKARLLFAATCCYVFLSAFLNKSCSGFIVYPRLLDSRDESGQLILHVHDGLTLTLEKSSVLANDFQYVLSSSTQSYTESLNGKELERNLYRDTMHTSSLIIDRAPGGGVNVRGVIGHSFRIAPHPVSSRSAEGESAHEISQMEESTAESSGEDDNENIDEQQCDPKDFGNLPVNPRTHHKFIVEICVVTTDSYAKVFNETDELVEYVAAMLNSVQLRYNNMSDPEIRFQLNELHTVEDEHLRGNETCPENYNTKRQGEGTSVCGFDAETTLNKSTQYINECATANCDIVYVLLRDDLTYMRNGTLSTKVQGIAGIGGVCSVDKAAVGEDNPRTFSGLTTMAHEIGHLLGSDHDGCPNATNCSALYGNLMSGIDRGMVNKSILSECSENQIRFLFKRLSDSCIYVNTTANFTNDLYPGEIVTHEELCQLIYPNKTVNASTEHALPCELNCCLKGTLESLYEYFARALSTESEEPSATPVENDDEDTTDDYESSEEILEICMRHYMLDGMTCNATQTCYKGICGNHNWDDIRRNYHTNRTFLNLSEGVPAIL